jgi:TolA-binding protein
MPHRVSRRKRSASIVAWAAAALVVAGGAFAWIGRARTERLAPAQARATTAPQTTPTASSPPILVPAKEAPNADAIGAASSGAPRVPSSDISAAELFARANDARRRGDTAAAARQYVALQARFPRSPEASVSHVTLGRLDLDRLGDPGGALVQFDEYLAGARNDDLSEEALVGRAIALQRLGRADEERNAWRQLLDAFPRSLSGDRARARMTELH